MLKKLWLDEGGAILSFELMLIMVILVIGITLGMVVLRDAIISEYQCVALAVNALYPGYAIADLQYAGNLAIPNAWIAGSDATSATLAIAPGNGIIIGDISAGGAVTPTPDAWADVAATTIASP
jgi:hypothetical protein